MLTMIYLVLNEVKKEKKKASLVKLHEFENTVSEKIYGKIS